MYRPLTVTNNPSQASVNGMYIVTHLHNFRYGELLDTLSKPRISLQALKVPIWAGATTRTYSTGKDRLGPCGAAPSAALPPVLLRGSSRRGNAMLSRTRAEETA